MTDLGESRKCAQQKKNRSGEMSAFFALRRGTNCAATTETAPFGETIRGSTSDWLRLTLPQERNSLDYG